MNKYIYIVSFFTMILSCKGQVNTEQSIEKNTTEMKRDHQFSLNKSDEEWKEILSDEEYFVLRQKGTERPGTGKYNLHFEDGTYKCNACGEPLFESDTKFDAHCGWPSFDKAIPGKVVEKLDKSHGMTRMEILCANCGSHLGHVFNDGPTDTGLRYCVNSVSLDFDKEAAEDKNAE